MEVFAEKMEELQRFWPEKGRLSVCSQVFNCRNWVVILVVFVLNLQGFGAIMAEYFLLSRGGCSKLSHQSSALFW